MSTATAKTFTVHPYSVEDQPLLAQMYESFEPKRVAMGLPPSDADRRRQWLSGLLKEGINLVAHTDDRAVGHLALMRDGTSAEMAVFVHQDWRRRGIGTELATSAIPIARQAGINRMWVLISTENAGAIQGLMKLGFRKAPASRGETGEAIFVREL